MEDIPKSTIPNTPPPTPLPPTSIPPQPPTPLTPTLPAEYTSPTALRLPTTWRCGTCASLHPILSLLKPTSPTSPSSPTRGAAPAEGVHCACETPSLQAVYDQFGALYLFWRDDPAVSDLRVPGMAEEARWRVWRAGGGEWEYLLGEGGMEAGGGSSGEGVVSLKVREGVARRWSDVSQSSSASDESGNSVRIV